MTDPRKPNAEDRELGRQLKQLRKDRRLTQSAVAECSGVSTQQYGKYERGENRLSVSRRNTILKCLDELRPGQTAGFSETAQASFEAPISISAAQKSIDDANAALKILQRFVDQARRS